MPTIFRLVSILSLTALYSLFLLDGYWGLGFTLINAGLVGLLLLNPQIRKSKESLFYLLSSLILSLFIFLRAFWLSHYLTILVVFLLNCLAVIKAGDQDQPLTLKQLVLSPILLLIYSFKENLNLLKRLPFKKDKIEGDFGNLHLGIIIRGTLFAVPLLILFFILLVSADPLFEKYVFDLTKNFKVNFELIFKIIQIIFIFGLFSAFLAVPLKNYSEFSLLPKLTKIKHEVLVVIIFLAILLALFLMVQAQYLFASQDLLAKMGVTLSEYARRGYAELLIISTISLSLTSLFVKKEEINKLNVKTVTIFFLIEIFLLLLSATRRTYLYQDSFGFTQARILGFLFSLWLTGVLGLFLLRILGSLKKVPLLFALFVNTLVMIFLMNLINVDYLIGVVKPPNLGYSIDYKYITTLSADSYPGWSRVIAHLEQTKDCTDQEYGASFNLKQNLDTLKRLSENNFHFGGSFVLSNSQALEFLEKNESKINQLKEKFNNCFTERPLPPTGIDIRSTDDPPLEPRFRE